LASLVKRGAHLYLEPWLDRKLDTADKADVSDNDNPFRMEVDLYEELSGLTFSCRTLRKNTAYIPRMHRLVYLLLLLLTTSIGEAVIMTLSLWLSAIAAYLVLTWLSHQNVPRLTTCARILAIAGLYINGSNQYLDLLRA
jgi:hypothetical protein